VFFSLQKFFSSHETQQLILGTGTAIWWVTEPHYTDAISESWAQCFKTFYICNLLKFIISLSVGPWQAFPGLMFVSKASEASGAHDTSWPFLQTLDKA
jgi:hypothetical protein